MYPKNYHLMSKHHNKSKKLEVIVKEKHHYIKNIIKMSKATVVVSPITIPQVSCLINMMGSLVIKKKKSKAMSTTYLYKVTKLMPSHQHHQ